MLMVSLPFTFVSFEMQGSLRQMNIFDTTLGLLSADYPALALVVGLAILFIPAVYLLTVAYLHFGLLGARRLPWDRSLIRLLRALEPWMMADVFMVAALVSMVKIAGQADVLLGPSFWSFAAFVLLLIRTMADVNFDALWIRLEGEPQAPFGVQTGLNAGDQDLLPCRCCHQLLFKPALRDQRCPRCRANLPSKTHAPLQATWALLLTAVILYIPANAYPIMMTTSFGSTEASTIMGGVLLLWAKGSWPIAAVIFVASILVPVVKMLVLLWLCLVAGNTPAASPLLQHRLYQVTEFVGRWSMVDVFVVAILVALMRSGQLMSVLPGPALTTFCSVVVLTMLAARAFDPRVIWSQNTQPTSPAAVPAS